MKIMDSLREKNVTLTFCIDVSSSVEIDGYKDQDKMAAMISIVQAME